MRLKPLVYRVFKTIESEFGGQTPQFCLLVSGGADSLCLLEVFKILNVEKGISFRVLHHFHGMNGNVEYRLRALNFVQERCAISDVPFLTNGDGGCARAGPEVFEHDGDGVQEESEDTLRQRRWQWVRSQVAPEEVICTAHHREDQLETQLMRLIRGTGAAGLRGMSELDRHHGARVFRPFLREPKSELVEFLMKSKSPWLEDPSNSSQIPLRNWLRFNFLAPLEQKCPGSTQALLSSLGEMGHMAEAFLATQSAVFENRVFLRQVACQKNGVVFLRHWLERQLGRPVKRSQVLEIQKVCKSSSAQIHVPVDEQWVKGNETELWVCQRIGEV